MMTNKDIKSIGYGVKVGKNYVSSENTKTILFGKIKAGTYLTKTGIMLFSDFDDAKGTAKEVNGKVIELYAREVSEDDLSKDN